ncbi:MAG: phosphatidylglycerophosphatase A [Candidatus Omnitrophica bacterium]|nr:phosphatidylglycerophosphatase A [Candidatus Omnitrophota bacterium]
MQKLVKFITSFFYLGHSPITPGTFGSLGGVAVYYLVRSNVILYAFTIFFLFMLGWLFTAEAERIYKSKDAKMIVIDEASGMLLALFCVPYSLACIIAGFILFRVFDITKVPPARQLEKFTGAYGVMLDDVIAAVYTNIILQLVFRVILPR